MNNSQKLAAIDAVYASLPKLECQRKCMACCQTFGMTGIELKRLQAVVGPLKTRKTRCYTENPLTFRGVLIGVQEVLHCRTCPMLQGDTCSVYAIRPLVCRIWGLTERTRCSFGCVPERWLTDEEAYAIAIRVQQLSA